MLVLRSALIVLLLLHGLIHVMGFAKAFELAELRELSLPISREWGAVWLVASVLLVGAATARAFDSSWWWLPALCGVVVSQALVVVFWGDAKFGTVANVIVLLVGVIGIAQWRFERMVQSEVATLQSHVHSQELVTEQELGSLPKSVRQWLGQAGVVGKPRVSTVKLQQRGRMRSKPGGQWMDFDATQWISTKRPGFVWFAQVAPYPGVFLYGRDAYQGGHGAMTISLLSLVPVVDAKGPKVDKASMLRYLGEMALYPSAALEPYVQWEQAGANAARATMTYNGVIASGIFRFDDNGVILSFEAKRYRETEEEDWLVEAQNGTVGSYPTEWHVSWQLDSGVWTWLELEIYDVHYDGELAQ